MFLIQQESMESNELKKKKKGIGQVSLIIGCLQAFNTQICTVNPQKQYGVLFNLELLSKAAWNECFRENSQEKASQILIFVFPGRGSQAHWAQQGHHTAAQGVHSSKHPLGLYMPTPPHPLTNPCPWCWLTTAQKKVPQLGCGTCPKVWIWSGSPPPKTTGSGGEERRRGNILKRNLNPVQKRTLSLRRWVDSRIQIRGQAWDGK